VDNGLRHSRRYRPENEGAGWTIWGGNMMSNDQFCELIEAIGKQKDRAAFADLFRYFAPRFKAYAMGIGCGNAEAEELAQETMISVWRRAETFDRTKATASTWMFTIVRNKRIDLFRRHKISTTEIKEAEQLSADTIDPGDARDAAKAGAALRQALSSLPPEQQLVLHKAFFEAKSHSVVAEELQIPLGTVKSRIRLALERLRLANLEVYA